ncbi:hypothetical protein V8G45_27600 [Klebsiella pneumoniae]|uniref:hypothetical protein n=1 Tax=Pseudomonadota TaxID=1224 RepID=UPI001E740429|nr:hypothetical protein [Burkholderia contaminans]UEP18744.1 hypothetical protein vBSbQDWS_64 [Shewanella phage vB_Sb_QDWS]UUX38564.1 hypothetical protein NTJ56_07095 [Burkholderia contaminans]
MKTLLRKIGELFALWIVVATILFVFVWLIVPKLIGAPDDSLPTAVSVPTRST